MSNLTSQDRATLNNFNQMTVGQIFKRGREDQNLTITQIAAHLNISSSHLEAIEGNDIANLPPKVYAVGFVRAYADLLSLDSEKMSYLFKIQVYGKKQIDNQKAIVQPSLSPTMIQETVMDHIGGLPSLAVRLAIIIFLGGVVIIGVVWGVSSFTNDTHIAVPDVPTDMLNEAQREFVPVESEMDQSPAEPMDLIIRPDEGATAYGANPLKSALAFKMKEKNTLDIRTLQGAETIIAKKVKAGDVVYVPSGMDILLSTDNAAAIEAYLDNQSLGLLGRDEEAIRSRPFSVEALRLQRGE